MRDARKPAEKCSEVRSRGEGIESRRDGVTDISAFPRLK